MNNEDKIEGLITEKLLSGDVTNFITNLKQLNETPESIAKMELFGDKKLGELVAAVLKAVNDKKAYDKEVKELSAYTKKISTSFSEPEAHVGNLDEASIDGKNKEFVSVGDFNHAMTEFTAAMNKMAGQIQAVVENVNSIKDKANNFSTNKDFAIDSDSEAFKAGVELANKDASIPEDKLNDKSIEAGFKSEADINNFKFGFNSIAKKAPNIGSGESKVEGGDGKTEADKDAEAKREGESTEGKNACDASNHSEDNTLFSVLNNIADTLESFNTRLSNVEANFSADDNVPTGESEVVDDKVKVDPVDDKTDVEDISLSEVEFNEYFADAEANSAIPEAVKEIKESDATDKQKLIATEFLKSEGVKKGVEQLKEAGVPEGKIEAKFVEKAAEIAEIKPEALEKKLDASETFSAIENITGVLEAFSERLGNIESALFSTEGEVASGESEVVDDKLKLDPVDDKTEPEKIAMSDTCDEPAPKVVEDGDGEPTDGSGAVKDANDKADKAEADTKAKENAAPINHSDDNFNDGKSKAWYDGMNTAVSDTKAKESGRAEELAKKFGYEDGSDEYKDFIEGFNSGIPATESKEENHSVSDFSDMSTVTNFSVGNGTRYAALSEYLNSK